MKIKHLLLAGALIAATAACSNSATGPTAQPSGPSRSEEPATTTTTAIPPDTTPRQGGTLGSGGG